MRIIGPDTYRLEIAQRKVTVRGPKGENHFVSPATIKKKPKLYVASADGALLYVGVTSQPMSTRLRVGMTAEGAHGYHGYAWGKKNHSIQLDVWYLDRSDVPVTDLEAIEAETVFLFRKKSGQWPKEQTEIHFHQSNEDHRRCAAEVINSLELK